MSEPADQIPPPELARDRQFLIALIALAAGAFSFMQWVTYTQYAANLVFLADAGIFDAIAAGPRHGHFLRYPLHWQSDANYFAAHFSPIFLVVMPLYFVVDHVMTLLTVFNLCLAGAAVPLGILARELVASESRGLKVEGRGVGRWGAGEWFGLAIAACWLANHFVASIQLANHPEAMAFVGWFVMFLAWQRRRWRLYAGAALWVLAVREDMALYLGVFGAFLLLHPRDRMVGVYTVAAAVAWWVMALVVIRLSGSAVIAAEGNVVISRFASFGDTKSGIVLGMLADPLRVLSRLLSWPLLVLFASAGFLALLDWRGAWMVLACAAVPLVADDPFIHEMRYYYSYPALAVLFLCTARGGAWLVNRLQPGPARHLPAVALLLVAGVSAPMATRTDDYRRRPFVVTDRHRLSTEVARMVPRDARVAVQYDLYVKVPNRPVKLPLRLRNIDDVDWVVMDLRGRMADLVGEEKRVEREELFRSLGEPEWETFFDADGFLILKRASANRGNT